MRLADFLTRVLPLRKRVIVGVVLAAMLMAPISPLIADGASFFDDMDGYDAGRWRKADGWSNGSPFHVGWRADHITHADGIMRITLDEDELCPVGCSGEPYASGELRTTGSESDAYYGYGCFEARLKAAAGSGLVTSFFTYKRNGGDQPPGANELHNEIDVEILGQDTTEMQVNFFTNGDAGHEYMVDLTTVAPGFDAAQDFHNYAFKWTAQGIEWYVDGSMVYSVANTAGDPTPVVTLAEGGPQKIMMNLWAVDSSGEGWAGPFGYTGPVHAEYDWVRYTAGDDCMKPDADFVATPRYGLAPLTVNFTDTSASNVTDWLWDFGDTFTSTQQHPIHTYTTAGSYTVTLAVDSLNGSDTLVRSQYITVNELDHIFLPVVLGWPPDPSIADDFEAFQNVGAYPYCEALTGWHKNNTWVGETGKPLIPVQNWSSYDSLKFWIKRVDVSSRQGMPLN